MPSNAPSPSRCIPIEPLTATTFEPFGTVIQNPSHGPSAPSSLRVAAANQGSATKYLDVTQLTNFYHLAPSKKPAKAVMNMFVCAPRKLRLASSSTISSSPSTKQLFDIKILERHPFTSQTFIPVGLPSRDPSTRYLVIVAPTLPQARSSKTSPRPPPYPTPEPRRRRSLADIFSRARPSPFDNLAAPPPPSSAARIVPRPHKPKGPGLPDLTKIRAFLADGSQAVTYAAGTWHAPMVVVGEKDVDFVVVQYANGVDLEDCQEVVLEEEAGKAEGLVVEIDGRLLKQSSAQALRSKL